MSIKNAWLGLIGRLPQAPAPKPEIVTVERIVPVGDSFTTVYQAHSQAWRKAKEAARAGMVIYSGTLRPHWEGHAYSTCAELFAACGDDAEAKAVKAFVVGDKAYVIGSIAEHALQPKPKVAKGRK